MSYKRVVPRDLFNESMLLKCLGRISVDILDNKLRKYCEIEDELEDSAYEHGFIINQSDDGEISCSNYHVKVSMPKLGTAIILNLFTPLNSRINYPLICQTHEHDLIDVFTDKGSYTKEFLRYLQFINEFDG